ncbi:MAG: phosphoribosylformylglycinamidine synthase subunit PurL [Patescibacteria group bacterium]|nr:phosphoribosylformylglycinamidine synthase subunit PurL [Patescibacteria group bacterium]
MIQTIRVSSTDEGQDLSGNNLYREISKSYKLNNLKKVRCVKIYRLENISQNQAKILAEKLFSENINQKYSLNKSLINGASHIFEISYKPGVMNPEVSSIFKAARDLGIKPLAVDSSIEYLFYGEIKKEKVEKIIKKLNLLNPIVEHIVRIPPKTLVIKGAIGKTQTIPIRKMGDDELLRLSKDKLFLNLEEMKIIQNYFVRIKRDPTDCELETIAQTWSEHCAHKTFKARLTIDGKQKQPLMTRLKKEALKHKKNIVSAFIDNSGVIDFYDGMGICGKVETHNSPSAIEPYGGAMTGSGGVFRDILGTGKGAKTIASTDIFCFAKPNMDLKTLPEGCLPPSYLLKRVVAGVRDYGNRMGIPTNNGSVHFHNDFRAKPTVIVGAYGIIPKKYAQKGEPKKGDLIIAVGGKTGRDGIHGATFSSGEMTHDTINVNSSAVQIGNAIEEKRTFDAILEARDANLIRAIQDCGAGGFSSAIGEMGQEIGVSVNLDKAPLKYQGLSPWEIWISESQERMVTSVSKNKLNKFLKICKKYNVEATVLGKFDGSKKLKVFYGKELICNLDLKFLHNGLPQREMTASQKLQNKKISKNPDLPKTKKEWISILKKVLSHENICSKEPVVRMYDHSVQGTNSMQPFAGENFDGPNDAAVIKPILKKQYGMIVSHGLNPILNNIDPYRGSIWAGVEAFSNYVAVGGNYKNSAIINNYIWPFPDNESLWSLDKSVDAVIDLMKALGLPVVSGKDSLSSTYRGKDGKIIKIPPVLCISVFGKIENVKDTASSDFKKDGSVICLIGEIDFKNMGGSIYFDLNNIKGDTVPEVNLKKLPKIFNAIYKGIQGNKILSVHDISEGGLITAIFEMCAGGNFGAEIDIDIFGKHRLDYALFSESAGCFVIEVENQNIAKQIFKGVAFVILGKTKKEKTILVKKRNNNLFEENIDELKKSWQDPMKKIF